MIKLLFPNFAYGFNLFGNVAYVLDSGQSNADNALNAKSRRQIDIKSINLFNSHTKTIFS